MSYRVSGVCLIDITFDVLEFLSVLLLRSFNVSTFYFLQRNSARRTAREVTEILHEFTQQASVRKE